LLILNVFFNIKGCSAVAPLFAALTARLMNLYGVTKIQNDFANGSYYRMFSFRDITVGSNVNFTAAVGWDPLTGMGSYAKYNMKT